MNNVINTRISWFYISAVNQMIILFWVLLVILVPFTSSYGQCQSNCPGGDNAFFGSFAGSENTTGARNSFFGILAGPDNTTGSNNSFFGEAAGRLNMSGSNNSFFGQDAGWSNDTGFSNSFFGKAAGFENTTGFNNSFFGEDAGESNSTGEKNSFFGHDAGKENITGNRNSFFGESAGTTNKVGSDNAFFGREAGRFNENGFKNSFFGHDAGRFNTSGQFNSFFGESAGKRITTGSLNICIGSKSGPTAADSTVLNRLYIDIEESDEPLIYGEFDNDFVRINGTFEATAVGNNSDINRKELIVPIDYNDILYKITDLPISEWSYKGDEIRHIGPMAQDFYAAFNVGKNETTITTIDADGVALASIKALHELNVKQQSEIDALKQELAELRSMITSQAKTATKE